MFGYQVQFIFLVLFFGSRVIHADDDDESRMIGGRSENEQRGNFVYTISLQRRSPDGITQDHICGGALIDYQWVLTSATCLENIKLDNAERPIFAVAGIVDVGDLTEKRNHGGLQQSKVIDKFNHPFYSKSENNLALLRVETPFHLTQFVQPIALPTEPIKANENFTMMGWGLMDDPRVDYFVSARYLSSLKQSVKGYEACNVTFPKSFEMDLDKVICIGEKKKTACTGDEGSPLVGEDNNLYGILSQVHPSCDRAVVYINVEPYVDTFLRPVMDNHEQIKQSWEYDNQNNKEYETTIIEAPFTVSIHATPTRQLNVRDKLCSGIIVGAKWVLTGAHCTELDRSFGSRLYVVAGISSTFPHWYESYSAEIQPVGETFVHPQYQTGEISNDLALLHIPNGFTDIAYYPMTLPTVDHKPVAGNWIRTTGFTITPGGEVDHFGNNHLNVANSTIISTAECMKHFQGEDSEKILCVEALQGKPCTQDTGGALFETNSRVLLGVSTLKMRPCGVYPTAYVRVSKHLDFLTKTMNSRS